MLAQEYNRVPCGTGGAWYVYVTRVTDTQYMVQLLPLLVFITYRAQWLTSKASHTRLREPGFESCAAVLTPWASCVPSTLLQFNQL